MADITTVVDEAFERATAAILSTNNSLVGTLIHGAAMLVIAAVEGFDKTGVSWVGTMKGLIPLTPIQRGIDQIERVLMDPNIEGIPIRTERIIVSRDVDVNESSVIVQNGYQRAYNINNAVPRLRQWKIQGYISTLAMGLGLDGGMTIKPTLMLQMKYLDAMAVSRMPCMFKTAENEFVRVIIQHYDATMETRANNAYPINLILKEFRPLEVKSVLQNITTLAKVG